MIPKTYFFWAFNIEDFDLKYCMDKVHTLLRKKVSDIRRGIWADKKFSSRHSGDGIIKQIWVNEDAKNRHPHNDGSGDAEPGP